MAEAEKPESLVEQYEVGDGTSVVETPVETAIPPSVETAPRDDKGRFASTSTPESGHPAYLVNMAKKAGFSEEEIQGIPPEALGLAIAKVHETQLADRREASIERTHHEARSQAARLTDAPAQPQKEDQFELSSEEYDDKLLDVLKRQEKQLKALQAEVAQLRNVEIHRQNETLTQKMDRLFADKKDQYGEEPGRKLSKDSPEMHRRLAVLSLMERLGPGETEDLFAKAHGAIYGKAKPVEPDKELESRKEEWSRGGVARPTHRNGAPELKGVGKAMQSVAAALREMGAADSEDTTSPDEFLGE